MISSKQSTLFIWLITHTTFTVNINMFKFSPITAAFSIFYCKCMYVISHTDILNIVWKSLVFLFIFLSSCLFCEYKCMYTFDVIQSLHLGLWCILTYFSGMDLAKGQNSVLSEGKLSSLRGPGILPVDMREWRENRHTYTEKLGSAGLRTLIERQQRLKTQ